MTAARPLAVVFPGQGSQRLGMGRDFHDRFAESRAIFEESSQACGLDLATICFEDESRLALTEFQQPAILTVELAMLAALRAHFGLCPVLYGGHSLGEYAALVAAGALTLADAVRLVRLRGRLMQEAVAPGEGAMVAILQRGIDMEELTAFAAPFQVDVANHNALDQAVLSGKAADVTRAVDALRKDPARKLRAIPLRVSAPFHSRHMQSVCVPLADALTSVNSIDADAAVAVTANASGHFHEGRRDQLEQSLTMQVTHTVRWVENMRALVSQDAEVIEVGPGRPLRGFFASLDVIVASVHSLESAQVLVERRLLQT